MGGNDCSQQGDAQGHDSGGAEALDEAGRHEPGQGRRRRAERRCNGEKSNPRDEDSTIAQAFSQGRARQERHDQGGLIGRDDQDRGRRRDVQGAGEGRQRHVGDGRVQHHQHQRGQHRRDGQGG